MFRSLSLFALAQLAPLSALAQTQQYCTGACQVKPSCSQGTTSISGTVFAPDGNEPLPNVTVYIAGGNVGPLTSGLSCPVPGAIPSGSPVAGATTNADGTFTINTDVPVNPAGQPQALVILSGKWRRIVPIDLSGGSCTNTPIDTALTRFPRNQSEGDIPKIAIATGAADPVECVLYKVMGNDATEFTNPSGNGRIQFYLAEGSVGTQTGSYIGSPSDTPPAATLTGSPSALSNYDVLMLPCEGADNSALRRTSNASNGELTNLANFANTGGRIYASHYSYDWLNQAQTFPNVASWTGNTKTIGQDGQSYPATINTTFADGSTLAQWLALPSVNASTTAGQIPLQTLRQDLNGVNAPTQSWMTLNSNNAVMQFTFDAPVNQTSGQCGRVLFNEYHVETAVAAAYPRGGSNNQPFPAVCGTPTGMTPQEKLLEYMLFNLTSNGGDPTLSPMTQDFGSEPIGFTTGVQTFTWKNNSIFSAAVTLLSTTGDFAISGGNPCTRVAAGATCTVSVNFTPTGLGTRTGTLVVGGGGKTITATLTGTGVPALTVSTTSMTFGSVDIGGSATQTYQITNSAPGPVAVPSLVVTGDYAASDSNCGSTMPSGAICTVTVTFRPTATGTRPGTLAFNSAANPATITITGNGIDFSMALSPTSGSVIAGRSITPTLSLTPIAGYATPVNLTCTTSTPGATCTLSSTTLVPAAGATATLTIQTTAQYTVVGYGSLGGCGLLMLLGGGSLCLLVRRRGARALLTTGLAILLIGVATLGTTGCGNKAPSQNSNPTGPGSYTFTVTATDGIITHTATYSLTVTTK